MGGGFSGRILIICCIIILTIFLFYTYKNNNGSNNLFGADELLFGMESFSDQFGNRIDQQRNFLIHFKNIRLNYRMEFTNGCPKDTKLIMLSMARRDGFDKRMGVRQTWMNDSVPGELIRFFVADVDLARGEPNGTQKMLEEEQTKYGDLVFLNGFEDKYKHIHLKWYAALQWQQMFCKNVEWVMKTDDDAVVHLRRLSYWMDVKFRQIVEKHRLVYIGHVLYNPDPIRDKNSKWYISADVYPQDWYPSFMQGTVYLTTSATISAILSRAKEIVGFYLDDVLFTGILAELANVYLSDHKNHFIRDFFLDRYGQCINGTPSAFSVYGVANSKGHAFQYGRLKSIKC